MIGRTALAWGALAMGLGFARSAAAQHVSPLVYELTPAGKSAAQTVVVWNSHHLVAAIDTEVEPLRIASDGSRQSQADDRTLLVTPAQFLLAPGEKRSVEVRYAGSASMQSSRTYKVHFRQLPLPSSGAQATGVRLLIDFTTLAHVVPDQSKADVRHEVVGTSGGVAVVRFTNEGTRFARIDDSALTISSDRGPVALSPAQLRERDGLGWLLPHESRTVEIQLHAASDLSAASGAD